MYPIDNGPTASPLLQLRLLILRPAWMRLLLMSLLSTETMLTDVVGAVHPAEPEIRDQQARTMLIDPELVLTARMSGSRRYSFDRGDSNGGTVAG
jgi:hypothetical protein